MVLEIPPAGDDGSITGSVDDAWQTAIEDVGPAGVDKGKGGKYLILPPGYKIPIPADYIAMPSPTYGGYAILRSNLKSGSDADVAKAVAYGKRVKFYPLQQADKAPQTTFVDALDVVYDSTIPYDLRFFESLHRIVQAEPWLTRDKAMIDTLKTIGIEKGTPFEPGAAAKDVLSEAIREARIWLDAGYEAACSQPFNDGTHWSLPASPGLVKCMADFFADPDAYPVDARGVTYSFGYTSLKLARPGEPDFLSLSFTFANYLRAYGSAAFWRTSWNTVSFAFAATLVAFVIGAFMAWVIARTNTPLARLIGFMLVGRVVIPGILIAISWILVASPNIGLFNQMMLNLAGVRNLLNVYSFWGMVWVQAPRRAAAVRARQGSPQEGASCQADVVLE